MHAIMGTLHSYIDPFSYPDFSIMHLIYIYSYI